MIVATAVIVVAGKWVKDEELDVKTVVGGGFLALGLSLLSMANEDLASKFALLVLVVACFKYIPRIANAAGLTNNRVSDWL